MFSEPIDIEAWAAIFRATRLSELKKHCRKITLHGSDLANLIGASWEAANFCHLPVFKDHHPEHLALSDEDLKALGTSRAGQKLGEGARKTLRKIDQTFKERRLFCGHLFWWIEDPDQLPKSWHFFHFDDKSISEHNSHWQHGSHVHLMNHLTHPNLPLQELLDNLDSNARPWLGGGLHIRFKR
jgi:hypothetical protein